MPRARALLPLLALAGACSRDAPRPSPPASAEPTASAAPAVSALSASPPAGSAPAGSVAGPAAASATAAPAAGLGPAVVVPPLPLLQVGMVDHLLPTAGWTRDGSALGYSVRIAVNLELELLRPNGAREHVHAEGEDEADAKRYEKRVQALGFLGRGAGRWAYAGELELTWAVEPEDCEKQPPVAAVVRVGARVPGEPPAFPINLVMGVSRAGCYGAAHPELVAVSPDGEHLGAIGHGFAGEWANDYPMGIARVAAVAEGAFNNAGLAHHRRGDYAGALNLFGKAVRADPTSKLATYNLACAHARLGDAEAERALAAAIALGGETVKQRARKDADFAGVSAKPWFTALVR